MVLQEPSRVDLLAALSEDEASGSAQWPLAPVGPAQATLDVFRATVAADIMTRHPKTISLRA